MDHTTIASGGGVEVYLMFYMHYQNVLNMITVI